LRSFLRILDGERMIALSQRFECGVRKASILNVGSPPQWLCWMLRLDTLLLGGLLLRLSRRGRTYCVGLRIARESERDTKQRHISNLQEARWSNQWVSKFIIQIMQKGLDSQMLHRVGYSKGTLLRCIHSL